MIPLPIAENMLVTWLRYTILKFENNRHVIEHKNVWKWKETKTGSFYKPRIKKTNNNQQINDYILEVGRMIN